MHATCDQTTEEYSDPVGVPVDRELDEVEAWARIADHCQGRALHFVPGCEDHHFCRLPFNVVSRDRQGRARVELCTSKSLGPNSAVLICRRELPVFQEVQLQLDDGQDRPWVRAKVTQSKQTIGGHAVRVKFLIEARRAA